MEKSLEAIMKWMKQSRLKFNEERNEICLFYKCDVAHLIFNSKDWLRHS
jgi:hypothetical protein